MATIIEFNFGSNACVLSNGAYAASFDLLVETGTAPDTVRTRHYYGTLKPDVIPGGYTAVQHDAVIVLLETPDLVSAAVNLARDIAAAALPTE